MARTVEEIKKDIEKVEYDMFIEEMADFIEWGYYRELKQKLAKLKQELEEVQNGG